MSGVELQQKQPSAEPGEKKIDIQDEKNAEEKKEEEKVKEVPYMELFRYATPTEWAWLIFGGLLAAANGVSLPGFSLVFGELLNSFQKPMSEMLDAVERYAIYFVYIGIGSFIASWVSLGIYMAMSERLAMRIRQHYLRAILRQDMAWFDEHKAGELSTRLAADTEIIQEGLGSKASSYIQFMSTFLSGIIIGFSRGWQLTLVILSVTPLLAISGATMTVLMSRFAKANTDAYAQAGEVADETLTSMKTVASLCGEQRERNRYTSKLTGAMETGIRQGITSAALMGLTMAFLFFTYGLALWFGAKLIADQTYNSATGKAFTGGDVVAVFFAVLMGAFALGQAAPSVPAFASAKGAAYKIFQVIDRVPPIDILSNEGTTLKHVDGDIVFEHVQFTYPTRKEVPALNGLDLRIPQGKTVALVGHSGCGKSTVVSLLERWYDPEQGRILVNGAPLTSFNLRSWRSQVGLVGQEPVLFSGTIKENIRYGRPEASDQEIIKAAQDANAHDFIMEFPQGYDTDIGESGAEKLSGGQKQRIAIARALVKNPSLLLLDESTSALDNESERIVQRALDRIMQGRTTVVIAHRLSTIRNADLIVVLDKGRVIDQGNHDELMERGGLYAELVRVQEVSGSETVSRKNGDLEEKKAEDGIVLQVVDSSQESKETDQKDASGAQMTKKALKMVPASRVLQLMNDSWGWVVVGCVGAVINGGVFPAFSQILAEMFNSFFLPDVDEMRRKSGEMAIAFVAIGVGMFIFNACQHGGLAIVGERLTLKLRQLCFAAMIRQPVSFFDHEENSPRILVGKLASEASSVRGMVADRAATLIQTMTMMITGLVLAFYYGWKMALLMLGVGPLVAVAGMLQFKFMAGFQADAQKALEGSNRVASESFSSIRTVSSFSCENAIATKYEGLLQRPLELGVRKANIAGVGFASSQFILFAAYALCFWFGAWLTRRNEMTFANVLKVFFAIVMSAMGLGQTSQMAPDAQKAQQSANSIFYYIDRDPEIDSQSDKGVATSVQGRDIVFENVHFSYPTRKEVKVYSGLNFRVPAGKKVALVGPSGCGKSTTVALLQRFYDPLSGCIRIGDHALPEYNLKSLREQIGLVSQEPVLFATSILENIRYARPNASIEEVQEAARAANAESFILKLPDGYNTEVGPRGSQMSGGQKQRIAIARALLKDPKILLLDEATSALDSESEKVVQAALEVLMRGRTTIIIAHRLSTIRDADCIYVFQKGQVVEAGNHDELMEKRGIYFQLASTTTQ